MGIVSYLQGATLSPPTATAIFVVAVLAGLTYRRTWKAEGARWKLWVSGLAAAACLAAVAFIPVVP
ncbi:MAG: hypothetical protein AAF330_07180 [Pseudomonadota bacterium]